MEGDLADAQGWLDRLTRHSTDITLANYPGQLLQLAGGGTIGLRAISSAAGPPTIDLNLSAEGLYWKFKFLL